MSLPPNTLCPLSADQQLSIRPAEIQECTPAVESHLFEAIALDLMSQGYSIKPQALPMYLSDSLSEHVLQLSGRDFEQAGIGRQQQHTLQRNVRKDEICWINGDSQPGREWLTWATELQSYLNRRLFLGLFSFESHFAHYRPGDFYKRHLDAFQGQSNRILSLVVYLNRDWHSEDGGELVLYRDQDDQHGQNISPTLGTIVTFLSEDFPHEVLAAQRHRYSIAGWFRLNSSQNGVIDPPR